MRDELPPPDGDDEPDMGAVDADGFWRDAPESLVRRSAVKRRKLEALLSGGKTQVRVDGRRPGCRLPDSFAAEPQLALNLSWRFPDTRMVVNERGVAATLRFGGVPFRVELPWHAVFAMMPADGEGLQLWPVDVPVELGGPPRRWEGFAAPPVEPRRPSLAVVAAEGAGAGEISPPPRVPAPARIDASTVRDPAEAPPEPPPEPPTPARPSWLRVVK